LIQFPLSLDACLREAASAKAGGRAGARGASACAAREGVSLPFLSPSPSSTEAVKDLVGAVSRHSGPDFHRDKLQPESSVFQAAKSNLDPGIHRGDEYSGIFSQLPSRQRREDFWSYTNSLQQHSSFKS